MDLLPKCICGYSGDRLLRGQPSDYLCPEASLYGLLELNDFLIVLRAVDFVFLTRDSA